MKDNPRTVMIEGALRLLAQRGLQATSFNEVLALTKTPRGSLYHHFPGGKDQLVHEALALARDRTTDAINRLTSDDPVSITQGFLSLWRSLLITTDFTAGCSVAAVTIATNSQVLLDVTQSVFESWSTALSASFATAGLAPATAQSFTTLIISACEGAVIVSRSQRSIVPFDEVAEQLCRHAEILSKDIKST